MSRYTVSGDGLTVSDSSTKLTWQRSAPTTKYSVGDGIAYCAALEYAGNACGWRLPDIDELTSLFELGFPSIDTTAFPSSQALFWSSTTGGPTGYYADFSGSGLRGTTDGASAQRIRCVR